MWFSFNDDVGAQKLEFRHDVCYCWRSENVQTRIAIFPLPFYLLGFRFCFLFLFFRRIGRALRNGLPCRKTVAPDKTKLELCFCWWKGGHRRHPWLTWAAEKWLVVVIRWLPITWNLIRVDFHGMIWTGEWRIWRGGGQGLRQLRGIFSFFMEMLEGNGNRGRTRLALLFVTKSRLLFSVS